jgi:Protein of unknown function (DUF664)
VADAGATGRATPPWNACSVRHWVVPKLGRWPTNSVPAPMSAARSPAFSTGTAPSSSRRSRGSRSTRRGGRSPRPGSACSGWSSTSVWVEHHWFRWIFAAEDVAPAPREGEGNEVQFRVDPGDAVDTVLGRYRSQAEHARRIESGASSLEDVSAREAGPLGTVSLRWILVHMIEETARHAGHMDLMREALDGRTGYF